MQLREAREASANLSADELLADYLTASDEGRAEVLLQRLMEEEATPVMTRALARKVGQNESEEVVSAARALLLKKLIAMRGGGEQKPIRNFLSYAAQIGFSAWTDMLRRENPQRVMLLNRLQYLLENRTARKGFALWEAEGRKWCGWLKQSEGERLTSPKLQWLLADPPAAGREIFGRAGPSDDLAEAVGKIFTWLETPIELRDLLSVIAAFWQISDRAAPLETIEAEEAPYISPVEELAWKEYLSWLWRVLDQLSLPQCAAFMLHANVLAEFEALGLASIRSLAPRIGFTPEKLATLWCELPLNDLRIAAELDCTRQQVINLRRVARDKLGKAWAEFSGVGNKRRVLASLFL